MTTTTGTSGTLAVYDFTIPAEKNNLEKIKQFLQSCAKMWVFQLERGEQTGYLHYQGKLSLISKKRLSTMIKFCNEHLDGAHVTPTVTQNMGLMFYVTKAETRVDGPWSDKDLSIPKHLRDTPNWYPWQQHIVENLNVYEERTINVIYDPVGCMGKSKLASWLAVRKLAVRIPVQNDIKDIMRRVMDCDKCNCYFVDMPRAVDKKHFHNFYAALEEIKNGYAYDDRYKFKEEFFDPPQVWVFTNRLPDKNYLSNDRWRLWRINEQTKGMAQISNIHEIPDLI